MRRMRRGRIGLRTLASTTKKMTSSEIATPPNPSVWADVQPSLDAVTMA